jgi:hypothetical protein
MFKNILITALVLTFNVGNVYADKYSKYDVWCNPLKEECDVTVKGKTRTYTRAQLYQ